MVRLILTIFMLINILIRPGIIIFNGSVFFGLAECLFLIGYLSWAGLEKRFGRFYLPSGLALATIGPWIEILMIFNGLQAGFDQRFRPLPASLPDISAVLLLASQIGLIFSLFIPLILISWQYPLKWVGIYSLGLIGLDILQAWLMTTPLLRLTAMVPVGAIVRTGLFLMIGFIVNRLAFEQKERNRQLSHYAATLEQLSTSRERNRLAREIHDTLAHTLSGLAVNLEAVTALWETSPAQAREIVDQSLTVTRSGLVETRRAIQALRAGPLEDLGLVLAMKQMALSYAERYSLEPDLAFPEKLEDLDLAVEQCIYRITEEGLRNLCQHARASRFRLSLARKDGRIELTLSDDGRGFDHPAGGQDEHFGIQGMQEWAEAAGGALTLSSRIGEGTVLKLVV